MIEPGVAKYYPIVSRAVAALEPNTPEGRSAIYDRARAAQASRLRELDPRIGDSVITRQRETLNEAISIVETVVIATEHAESDSKIISAFATFCEDTKTRPDCFYDVSVLPYPKHAIVAALERQIVLEVADIRAEWLQQGQMFLWNFLEGVGSLPVPAKRNLQNATPEEIRELAKQIVAGDDRTEQFHTLAWQEADQIIQRINAALQFRQERLAVDKEFDRERLRLNDAIASTLGLP